MIVAPVRPILLSENMAQLSRALRHSRRARTRQMGSNCRLLLVADAGIKVRIQYIGDQMRD
jgi:hypothetical protein